MLRALACSPSRRLRQTDPQRRDTSPTARIVPTIRSRAISGTGLRAASRRNARGGATRNEAVAGANRRANAFRQSFHHRRPFDARHPRGARVSATAAHKLSNGLSERRVAVRQSSHGLTTSTPAGVKSLTLRVITGSPWWRAVAAIRPSGAAIRRLRRWAPARTCAAPYASATPAAPATPARWWAPRPSVNPATGSRLPHGRSPTPVDVGRRAGEVRGLELAAGRQSAESAQEKLGPAA